jgi:hypothetical protein
MAKNAFNRSERIVSFTVFNQWGIASPRRLEPLQTRAILDYLGREVGLTQQHAHLVNTDIGGVICHLFDDKTGWRQVSQ